MRRRDFDCLLGIRDLGCCNMFDVSCVQRTAYNMGFYSLAVWIEKHKVEYCNLILTGKVVFDTEDNKK